MKKIIHGIHLHYVWPYFFTGLITAICSAATLHSSSDITIGMAISAALNCLFLWLFFQKDLNQEKKMAQKEFLHLTIKYILIILVANNISNLISVYVNNLALSAGVLQVGEKVITNQGMIDEMFSYSPFAIILTTLLAGFSEELIYRYAVYKMFDNQKIAFVISFLFFASGHIIFTSLSSLITGIVYFSMSLVLTYLYHSHHNIYANMLVHISMNAIGLVLMALGH